MLAPETCLSPLRILKIDWNKSEKTYVASESHQAPLSWAGAPGASGAIVSIVVIISIITRAVTWIS